MMPEGRFERWCVYACIMLFALFGAYCLFLSQIP